MADAELIRAAGVAEGAAQAAQVYFGQSAIRLTVGLFASALQSAAGGLAPISPDAAEFFAAKAAEFAEFAHPPQVQSISPATDAANVQVSDQIVLGFTAALDPDNVNSTCFTVGPTSGGARLNADVHYDGVHTVTIIPHNGFSPGVSYTVTVSKNVKSKVGQSMGTDYTSNFTTAS